MSGQYAIYVISAAAFLSIVALIDALYVYWRGLNLPGRNKVDKRLHELYAGGIDREEALSLLRNQQISSNESLDAIYSSIPRLVVLHRFIEQSGLHLSVSGFLLMEVVLACVFSSFLYFFTQIGIFVALALGGALGLYLPYMIVKHKRNQRTDLLKKQLPEALDYIARSLRAGNPFSATIKQVSVEMPEPISVEFGITFDEINFGLDLNHALHGLHERTQIEEVRYFVAAVLLQRDTGGNLGEVLNRIAAIIRSRSSTKQEIKILSAEMKQSANVLLCLPFFVAAAIWFMNPKYFLPLIQHEAGWYVIGAQGFLMLCGYLIVQKLVSFRV